MTLLPGCKIGEQLDLMRKAVVLLNDEGTKPAVERDQAVISLCVRALGILDPKYKINPEQTRIELAMIFCGTCSAAATIEFSDPIEVVGLPSQCPEATGLRVLETDV